MVEVYSEEEFMRALAAKRRPIELSEGEYKARLANKTFWRVDKDGKPNPEYTFAKHEIIFGDKRG